MERLYWVLLMHQSDGSAVQADAGAVPEPRTGYVPEPTVQLLTWLDRKIANIRQTAPGHWTGPDSVAMRLQIFPARISPDGDCVTPLSVYPIIDIRIV